VPCIHCCVCLLASPHVVIPVLVCIAFSCLSVSPTLSASRVIFVDGQECEADLIVWAAGADPPELLQHSALPRCTYTSWSKSCLYLMHHTPHTSRAHTTSSGSLSRSPTLTLSRSLSVFLSSRSLVLRFLLVLVLCPCRFLCLRRTLLHTGPNGYLLVNKHLQSVDADRVFGAGDCVSIEGCAYVTKAGVYAVREGPVLAENLLIRLRCSSPSSLRSYTPQKGHLALIMTGDGEAISSWKGLAWTGTSVWALKDRIDREFMDLFDTTKLGPAPSTHLIP
jgi:hypothetical protein